MCPHLPMMTGMTSAASWAWGRAGPRCLAGSDRRRLAPRRGQLLYRKNVAGEHVRRLIRGCQTRRRSDAGPSCSQSRLTTLSSLVPDFAEIIEARRARGCGALGGHRTGLARGNLNRACPRHNFSGTIRANRTRSCCALCELRYSCSIA